MAGAQQVRQALLVEQAQARLNAQRFRLVQYFLKAGATPGGAYFPCGQIAALPDGGHGPDDNMRARAGREGIAHAKNKTLILCGFSRPFGRRFKTFNAHARRCQCERVARQGQRAVFGTAPCRFALGDAAGFGNAVAHITGAAKYFVGCQHSLAKADFRARRAQQKCMAQKSGGRGTHDQHPAAKGHAAFAKSLHQKVLVLALPEPQTHEIHWSACREYGQVQRGGAAVQARIFLAQQHGGQPAAVSHGAGQGQRVVFFQPGKAHGRAHFCPVALLFG